MIQQKLNLENTKQDKEMEMMRMLKQTSVKMQDMETNIMQIQSEID